MCSSKTMVYSWESWIKTILIPAYCGKIDIYRMTSGLTNNSNLSSISPGKGVTLWGNSQFFVTSTLCACYSDHNCKFQIFIVVTQNGLSFRDFILNSNQYFVSLGSLINMQNGFDICCRRKSILKSKSNAFNFCFHFSTNEIVLS